MQTSITLELPESFTSKKQYFQFEKGTTGYQTFSFAHLFTHSKLPELSLNFDDILKEAMDGV